MPRWVPGLQKETARRRRPATGGRFINNIVYYSLGDLSTHVNVGPDTEPESFVFSNNLWYAIDAPADSEPAYLPVIETDSVYGEDPGFAGEDDEAITLSSPAAGGGLALGEVPGDVDGICYEDPPAIGAHEVE